MWVRGLKQQSYTKNVSSMRSHPMWVRGLKLVSSIVALAISSSHPMWVRGLKLEQLPEEYKRPEVAPYVGAWIETILRSNCTVI